MKIEFLELVQIFLARNVEYLHEPTCVNLDLIPCGYNAMVFWVEIVDECVKFFGDGSGVTVSRATVKQD